MIRTATQRSCINCIIALKNTETVFDTNLGIIHLAFSFALASIFKH